jgi:Leucine-rich repeat (LRR) protein
VSQNRIRELPASLFHLPKLEQLGLSFNRIHFLSLHITKLSSLQNLALNNNALSSLPPEIGPRMIML